MDYLVYEYGCLPPLRGREAAVEQMLRRHRLWNSLVEVERDYRSQLSALLRDETSETVLASARCIRTVIAESWVCWEPKPT